MSIKKDLQNAWHDFINHVQTKFMDKLEPALDVLETTGRDDIIELGEEFLKGKLAGQSWSDLIKQFVTHAKAMAIDIAEKEAAIILNFSESNLIAKGEAPVPVD